jgi:RHS repeat-associated protein
VDQAAAVVSYEEYHPYGSTALWLAHSGVEVSERRYRYIGKERDSETGLYACGARYYAPWLGRWTAADPAGFVDGANRYAYARDNPIKLADPAGRQAKGTITVETEVRLVNKRTGRLETVSKEKYFIIPEVTIEGDPKESRSRQRTSIPARTTRTCSSSVARPTTRAGKPTSNRPRVAAPARSSTPPTRS